MFRCQDCDEAQPPCSKPHRVVVQKRQQTYSNNGIISRGWEIVEEANLCDRCYDESPLR